MTSLNVKISTCRYQVMLGVGGIGTGVFFSLNGENTLGREESRSGHFIDRRDYCKLHIITHYVQALLGAEFVTLPIGRVGADEAGGRLLHEMGAVGMDLRYARSIPGSQTLYSFCFIYPDGSGGNLTTDNSACDQLEPEDVGRAEADFSRFQAKGIALAAPEVPLTARQKLLELGTQYHFLRVAAFNSAEILPALEMEMLTITDLLALNRDEAAAVAGIKPDDGSPLTIVEAALAKLWTINPALQVTITAGKEGSWSWDGKSLRHVPAFPTRMVSTAGAGDAFLAGVIAGLVADLPLHQAQELGTLVAALSVTSPHTINPEIERRSLHSFSSEFSLVLSETVKQLLQD
jgi:ribokinase